MDPYTRARTVRIGKWRWPPPKDESAIAGEQPVEGFFEFKMRKMNKGRIAKMVSLNGRMEGDKNHQLKTA